MRFSAMKALRSLSILFAPQTLRISRRTLLRPAAAELSRQFGATASSRDSAPKVWAVYDPLTGRTQTHRPAKDEPQSEPESESETEERTYRSEKKLKAFSVGEFVVNRKRGKAKTFWLCSTCGYSDGQWWGICRSCKSPGTMNELSADSDHKPGSWVPKEDRLLPVRLKDVARGVRAHDWRISLPGTFGSKVDRVLGGGLV